MPVHLKDFFDQEIITAIALDIAHVHPQFNTKTFIADCLQGLAPLELIARARHIAHSLHTHLPKSFPTAASIIIQSLQNPTPAKQSSSMASFRYQPHTHYVAIHGLNHFEESMQAQHALTQVFTAEFSIRDFIEKHPQATLARLQDWAKDPSHHVRRLVSEGTRPRLPWASRLRAFQQDPAPVIQLLELLKDDPELYVRRSVANNLNDIAKDHPNLTLDICTSWSQAATPARKWIVKQALRSLIKQGNPRALSLMGASPKPKVTLTPATLTPTSPQRGDSLKIHFNLSSQAKKTQSLVIDYRVHFCKANGTTAPKVFKLKQVDLAPGATITCNTTLTLKQLTTRKIYPGQHHIDALVNGQVFPLGSFLLR